MQRQVRPEWLDTLPADHPQAVRSRRDLRRINAWMGNARLLAAPLAAAVRRAVPSCIVDLGAGDGAFLLSCARHLPALPRGIEFVLVDRNPAPDRTVLDTLRARGCAVRLEQQDALTWLRAAPARPGTWVLANLFLHHLGTEQLSALLALVAERTVLFCACEPRRAAWPLAASRCLWLLGANAVTRHDAVVSVRAGFEGRELSALWPTDGVWRLQEGRAGLFSHLFCAQRDGLGAQAC